MDPAELRLKNLLRPEQFPYTTKTGWVYDSGDYEPTLREAMRDRRLRRAAPRAGREARARRADGHRRLVLHRGGRRRPAQGHGHPRPRHGRRLRAAGAPDRQGRRAGLRADPGPGPRDDVRPDRRRGDRHPARRHRGRPRRHRPDAVRPRHVRQPLHAGLRRRGGAGRPQGAGQGAASSPPAMLEVSVADLEWEKGAFHVKGDPTQVGHHPGHRDARARRRRPARGHRGRARGADLLQPVEPHLPARRLHLRGRRRPRAPPW